MGGVLTQPSLTFPQPIPQLIVKEIQQRRLCILVSQSPSSSMAIRQVGQAPEITGITGVRFLLVVHGSNVGPYREAVVNT